MTDLGLLGSLVDDLDLLLAVVDPDGSIAFANETARKALAARGLALPAARPCDQVAQVVRAVQTEKREKRNVRIAPEGFDARWRGRFWLLEDDRVALLLHRDAPRRASVAGLAAALGIEHSEARLALQIAQGRSNLDIAGLMRIPPSTVRNRVSTLYRKAGVKNRAELISLVVRSLQVDDESS